MKHILLQALLIIWAVPGYGKLVVSEPTNELELFELREFILYNPVSKSQVLAFETTLKADRGSIGLIVPVAPGTRQSIGKRSLFEVLTQVTKPKGIKQRQLKLKMTSYLLSALSTTSVQSKQADTAPHRAAVSSASESLSRADVLKWVRTHGLYATIETVETLHALERQGYVFTAILLHAKHGHIHHRSPTFYLSGTSDAPKFLPQSFAGKATFDHYVGIISDKAYRLKVIPSSGATAEFRAYRGKRTIRKLLAAIPKALHSYDRAGYIQNFKLPTVHPLRVDSFEQRLPEEVRPARTASYDPLIIQLPVELLLGGLILFWWLWNRERFQIKSARRTRIRQR